MKRNLVLAFSCIISLVALGQTGGQPVQWHGGCGAVAPPSFYQAYAARDRSNYPALLSQRTGITWIPIVYHLAAMDDGTASASLQSVFYSNCYLNTTFNQFGIGFFILNIDTINSTELWEYASDPAVVFDQYNVPTACNVYIPGNMGDLCGVGTFPYTYPNGGGVFVSALCFGEGTTTLNHEMGHFFGLLHTFDTTYGVEFVNGTNCKVAGDLFCDTPADFLDYVSSCPYTGDQTDPNGDLYRTVIDPTLFMSYFEDYCVKRFSNMEEAEMVNTLSTQRPELLNQQAPNVNPPDSVTFIAPQNGDDYVSTENMTFRWDTVPGAIYYYFHLQSANTVVIYADTVVTQNYFTVNKLVPGKPYKYFVQAMSLGNTCNNAGYENIETATITTNFTVSSPLCGGLSTGTIAVIPQGGVPPYFYYWNTGSVDSMLTGVAEGDYRVTVSDDNGSQVSSYIHLDAPGTLLVSVNTQSGDLVAHATGGTLPYFYRWSNGVNEAINYGVAKGDYHVSVTDGHGCTASENVDYTSVAAVPEMKAGMHVFPNPVYSGSQINVRLQLNKAANGTFSLVNLNGEVVFQLNQGFVPGTNHLQIGTGLLPPGVYLLRFISNDVVLTGRVSLL